VLEYYYSTEKILNSVPLPTTRALINFLSEAAIEDSFSYYAANEVLQMTENVPEEEGSPVSEFYDALRHHYPNVQPLIRSFAAHTELDQKLGHENVFKEICGDVALLSAHQINRAMEQSQAAAEHLLLFLDGIHRHYSRVESPLRMPSVVGSD
jgi:pyrroloquinoline quinone (PQQ) biosynthesis protein C